MSRWRASKPDELCATRCWTSYGTRFENADSHLGLHRNDLPAPPTARIEIRDRLDIHDVQLKTRALATALGFHGQRVAEALVVASELATNILRHSAGGSIELAGAPHGSALCVIADDRGPLIADFERALEDGSGPDGPIVAARTDSPFGAATGLGAVQRLSDALAHDANASGGNRIAARLEPRARVASER